MAADPLLPPDGDYPTDEIDVWPMLAEDAPAEAFVVDANGARHGKRNGRFVRKPRAARPDGRRAFTWDEVKGLPTGPEHAAVWANRFPEGPPNIYEWPDEPGVEWETTYDVNGPSKSAYAISKPVGLNNTVRVNPPAAPMQSQPDPARVRIWARRNGLTVSNRGRIPAKVMNAYLATQGGR